MQSKKVLHYLHNSCKLSKLYETLCLPCLAHVFFCSHHFPAATVNYLPPGLQVLIITCPHGFHSKQKMFNMFKLDVGYVTKWPQSKTVKLWFLRTLRERIWQNSGRLSDTRTRHALTCWFRWSFQPPSSTTTTPIALFGFFHSIKLSIWCLIPPTYSWVHNSSYPGF